MVALLLGWCGVHAVEVNTLWRSADFATSSSTVSVPTAVGGWLLHVSKLGVAVFAGCMLLLRSKAGRLLFGVTASCFAAAAVAHHLAAAAEAALGLSVSMLWAVPTAVEVLLKGCVAALFMPSLVKTLALLAASALFCLVEVSHPAVVLLSIESSHVCITTAQCVKA